MGFFLFVFIRVHLWLRFKEFLCLIFLLLKIWPAWRWMR